MRRLTLAFAACTAVALATTAGAANSTGPTYASYVLPTTISASAGEPSVGVNWKTGAVFLQAGLSTAKASFDSANTPTWSDVTDLREALITLDAVAATDNATGRLFVSQLVGFSSILSFTDDDGQTWSSSQGSGAPAGADHQTVGAGPYPAEGVAGPLTTYPNAVYYCSQSIATALCARSDTGGLTFGPGLPTYTVSDCSGLHGHVRVSPDGTVYLPNKNCGGHQSVVVSRDAGTTWAVRPIPGSTNSLSDPSVAAGKDGTAYVSWVNANGTIHAAVSGDKGSSWSHDVDLGEQVGVVNATIPSTIAGDGDRAAVAFLGTKTEGKGQDQYFGQDETHKQYVGAEQHLYVATTYNRGKTWKTVDVTPKDAVQRGRVCLGGTGCTGGDRNLLDFLDIGVDRQGRVVVGWADGCTGTCLSSDLVASNPHTAVPMLSRQTKGQGLFASPPKVL